MRNGGSGGNDGVGMDEDGIIGLKCFTAAVGPSKARAKPLDAGSDGRKPCLMALTPTSAHGGGRLMCTIAEKSSHRLPAGHGAAPVVDFPGGDAAFPCKAP